MDLERSSGDYTNFKSETKKKYMCVALSSRKPIDVRARAAVFPRRATESSICHQFQYYTVPRTLTSRMFSYNYAQT